MVFYFLFCYLLYFVISLFENSLCMLVMWEVENIGIIYLLGNIFCRYMNMYIVIGF